MIPSDRIVEADSRHDPSPAADGRRSIAASLPACPVCGGALVDIKQKRICTRCRTICETCCEGGRG